MNGESQLTDLRQARAMATSTLVAPDEFKQNLPPRFEEGLKQLGARWDGKAIIREVPLAEQDILVNGKPQVTDKDGRFMVPTKGPVSVVVSTETSNLSLRAEASRSGTDALEFRTDVTVHMCCLEDETGDNRGPMDSRCLDYNGFFSDHGNYPLSDWRAFRNFIGSDCDRALSRCILDHLYSGGCMGRHGGCSKYIGHSQSEHWHNLW